MNKILKFLFELGQLKNVPRSGWHLIGITNPESVAEHSARTAQVAYILALLEKSKEPERVAAMALFHDISECRVTDLHKVAQRYVESNEVGAVDDMLGELGETGKRISELWKETAERATPSAVIAKDADLLDVALTAKEYMTAGYVDASDWYQNVGKALKTPSARMLWEELSSADPNSWWKGLKKLS